MVDSTAARRQGPLARCEGEPISSTASQQVTAGGQVAGGVEEGCAGAAEGLHLDEADVGIQERREGGMRAAFVAETSLAQARRTNGSYELFHAERHRQQRPAQAIQQRLLVMRELPDTEGDAAMAAAEVQ